MNEITIISNITFPTSSTDNGNTIANRSELRRSKLARISDVDVLEVGEVKREDGRMKNLATLGREGGGGEEPPKTRSLIVLDV